MILDSESETMMIVADPAHRTHSSFFLEISDRDALLAALQARPPSACSPYPPCRAALRLELCSVPLNGGVTLLLCGSGP